MATRPSGSSPDGDKDEEMKGRTKFGDGNDVEDLWLRGSSLDAETDGGDARGHRI